MVVAAAFSTIWDDGVRQPHRVWQGGNIPGATRPLARSLLPAERQEILAECMGYVSDYRTQANPGPITILNLTTLQGGVLRPRGTFFDRLPEFLCQLGDGRRQDQFI